ncbi:peptidylprolyl isomerase, partial [Arthrospira platensis SPKY1]|nr:peptidylprolyl isomerase [Arthrospira platensis SPKY1]
MYSSLQRGRSMGGELYYVSAGATVEPFEDTMYSLQVGEVSLPFRSQYGMHLAQVNDRRPRQADRKLSHMILFDQDRNYTPEVIDSLK